MSPYLKALSYFDGADGAEVWQDVVDMHMFYGYVHISPEYVIFAYPTAASLLAITEQGPQFTLKDPKERDTWFIYFACGDLKEALKLFPYPLPWIAWRYKGRPPRVYKFDRMVALLRRCALHESNRRSQSTEAARGVEIPTET